MYLIICNKKKIKYHWSIQKYFDKSIPYLNRKCTLEVNMWRHVFTIYWGLRSKDIRYARLRSTSNSQIYGRFHFLKSTSNDRHHCSILMIFLPIEARTYVVLCDYFKIFLWSTDFKYSWFKHKLKLFVFKCTIILLCFLTFEI